MDEHPNAIAYHRTADAFRAGDTEALRGLIADDVVWQHERWLHPTDPEAWDRPLS